VRRLVRLPPDASGRLDRALADALHLGRASLKRAFAHGEVRVAGRRVRAADPAEPGLEVALEVADPLAAPAPEPERPLTVHLEQARFLVVEKPAGVAVHPLKAGEGGTLANAVVARFPECAAASLDPREGGAAQRLDLETSGCVLFARDRDAWERLHDQLRRRTVEKVYLALVCGRPSAGGVCTAPLAQRGGRVLVAGDAVAEDRLRAQGLSPRPAETRFEVERRFARHTLLRVRIATGAMHQIRAHLAHLGYPVAADRIYGGEAAGLPGLHRHFLHAARLGFESPDGGRVVVESPLPGELEAVLASLQAAEPS
jgi:23S rRNA pseudouridine1911/1915/1917 synthase